jgi:hypothetical protein
LASQEGILLSMFILKLHVLVVPDVNSLSPFHYSQRLVQIDPPPGETLGSPVRLTTPPNTRTASHEGDPQRDHISSDSLDRTQNWDNVRNRKFAPDALPPSLPDLENASIWYARDDDRELPRNLSSAAHKIIMNLLLDKFDAALDTLEKSGNNEASSILARSLNKFVEDERRSENEEG